MSERALLPNPLTHAYDVRIAIDSVHAHTTLLPGMVCRVTMDEQRVEGILLPAECIQTGQQGKTVWLLQGGRAIRQQVVTGPFVGEQVLITDGLRRGDRVVVAGIQKLYNGCEVIVQ